MRCGQLVDEWYVLRITQNGESVFFGPEADAC